MNTSALKRLPLLLGLSCALLLSGCLARAPLTKQEFLFAPSPLPAHQGVPGTRVLQIRRLSVAAPFDSQSFLYRTGPYSYERDPYAEFLVPPEQALLAPLRGSLRDTGLFSQVVGRDSPLPADMLVEIQVRELYGDFRQRSAPAAVLRVDFSFFDAAQGAPGKVRLQKSYLQSDPVPVRTAAALMAGWNQGLQHIVAQVAADLKSQRNSEHE